MGRSVMSCRKSTCRPSSPSGRRTAARRPRAGNFGESVLSNRILVLMHRRLLALVLGLVVAGAPEALEACQVFCTSAAHTGMPIVARHAEHGHSGHRVAAPAAGAGWQAAMHVCGHDDALPTARQQILPTTAQPASIVTILPAIPAGSARPIAPAVRPKPPRSGPFAAQLRV
jgi:hypothetical protein